MTQSAKWSKMLFNNAHLLRVAAAISLGPAETDCGTLQRELALGQTAVRRVLRTLEGVSLLERLERRSQTDPIKYRKVAHPFWDATLDLLTAAERSR